MLIKRILTGKETTREMIIKGRDLRGRLYFRPFASLRQGCKRVKFR